MKGTIKEDHIPTNKYIFKILGLVDITVIEVSGLEDELETIDLPDRTVASNGHRKASEITIMVPMHHEAEQAALEVWFKESQDPVAPTYKKPVTLTHESISGNIIKNYSLAGVFPKKRNLPDLEMANDTDHANVEWVLSVDDILPL